ncbi:MAG: carbon starvation protein A [Planctomycetes bacterium]|nr:carbon starvation protein A [Planctomycetota bacterium]
MTVLLILGLSILVLLLASRFYSRKIAGWVGLNPSRPTPATVINDGRDFVPSPTPVVFGHHFAAIAGAGPIIGPVIAAIYGWLPALLWVVIGGVLIGAVHDFMALYISMREGGRSIASIARRYLGKSVFLALMLFLVVMLSLVCATFLNLSATALVSWLPLERSPLPADNTLIRTADVGGKQHVMIGGIASMSVVVITILAPLIGWMYIKRKINVWICSAVAVAVCALSIVVGLYYPINLPQKVDLLGWLGSGWHLVLTGQEAWKLLLSTYVLLAAGLPVWMFLQSRDFVNAHILYVGLACLLVTLVAAAIIGQGQTNPADFAAQVRSDPMPMVAKSPDTLKKLWPALFITIACGAVSGFHSLCAGGTTCKQLSNEAGARRVGYNAMLLESFVAVCVIAALLIGTTYSWYRFDIYPGMLDKDHDPNQPLGFAVALGWAANIAWGLPVAYGTLAGMIMLEGFLITTLDAAVRLMRYLLEEIWHTLFEKYDVYAAQSGFKEKFVEAAGSEGVPTMIELKGREAGEKPAPATVETKGILRFGLKTLRHYWINSGAAVALMLVLAFTGGAAVLWDIFATSNQLLAAMVLSLASLWLLRQGRKRLFVFIPAIFMLATTCTNLVLLLPKYAGGKTKSLPLLTADIIIMILTAYLLVCGVLETVRFFRTPRPQAAE